MNSHLWNGPDPKNIKSLFSSIASGYDKANDWITFGRAHNWRKTLVTRSHVTPTSKVLDCATGTGDLAIEFAKRIGPQGKVIGVDFCQEMLQLAPQKSKASGLSIQFQLADVLALPFEDKEFDVVSIAYGIRNVQDPLLALKEMARVVRPGGRVMILETGDSANKGLQYLMNWYFRQIVPRIGGYVTGRREAYEYLNRSSTHFPSKDRFVELMTQTEMFQKVDFFTLMGGASFIYQGTRI